MADAQGNRYGPYDIEVAGSEAEALTEEAWFDLFGHVTGVKSGGALTFNGLTATLAPIDMRVHGSYLIRVDPWSIASPATAAGANPRRDMLVARRQRTVGSGPGATPGETFLTLLQGTPAATPAEPTTFDPVNDEPLWSWQVPGNGGTVVTGIRDLRATLLPGGGKSVATILARDTHFPAPKQGQTCTVGGVPHTHDGTKWKYSHEGPFEATTDAGGNLVIPHGLGVVPTTAFVTPGNQLSALLNNIVSMHVTNSDATNLVVYVRRDDTNAGIPDQTVRCFWRASV